MPRWFMNPYLSMRGLNAENAVREGAAKRIRSARSAREIDSAFSAVSTLPNLPWSKCHQRPHQVP
jgi:hypothetical protein